MIAEPGMPARSLYVVTAVLRRIRLVVLLPLAAAFIAAVASLLVPVRYRGITSFVSAGRRMPQLPSAIAGLASQLMPGFAGSEATQTPGYYVQILQSRELLVATLGHRFTHPDADSATLLDIIVPPSNEDDAEKRLDLGVRRLRDAMSVSADNQTGIIQAGIELRNRHLAAEAANALPMQLNAFTLRMSRDQAGQRRVFVEERRDEVAEELRQAELRLRAFMMSNRMVQGAPDLEYEQGRLQRQVAMVQEMFLTLNRAYDNMRVEESNNVAAITVIDPAIPSVKRSYPSRRVWVMMAFFLGLTLALALVAGLEWLAALKSHDEQSYRELRTSWDNIPLVRRTRGLGSADPATGP